jgi:hypothetical protein
MFLTIEILTSCYQSKIGRLIILTIIISLSVKTTQAQESTKKNNTELRAGVSLNKINNIDKSFSSVPYCGITPGFSLAATFKKKKSLLEFGLNYNEGNKKVSGQADFRAHESYLDFNLGRLYTINKAGRNFKYMLGVNLDILYAKRQYSYFPNRKKSYEFAGSLCLAFKAIYPLDKYGLRSYSIIENISIPLLSVLVYPAFGTEQLPGDIDGHSNSLKSLAKSSRVAGFGTYQRVVNSLAINKNILSRHRLSLLYNWDFYNITDTHNVRQAIHSFNVCYALIL